MTQDAAPYTTRYTADTSEGDNYLVLLESMGDKPELVMSKLKVYFSLSAQEVSGMARHLPVLLPNYRSQEGADFFVSSLTRVGAKIEAVSITAPPPPSKYLGYTQQEWCVGGINILVFVLAILPVFLFVRRLNRPVHGHNQYTFSLRLQQQEQSFEIFDRMRKSLVDISQILNGRP